MSVTATEDRKGIASATSDRPRPGLLLAFAGDEPRFSPLPLADGRLAVGRNELLALGVDDKRVSRRHLLVARAGGTWTVQDEGSKNGTFLDGEPLLAPRTLPDPRVVRIGGVLLLFVADLRAHERFGLSAKDGVVRGPSLLALHERIARTAAAGTNLLVLGETGSGKELCAHAFHDGGPRPRGPFVAVNCASVPREIAERLFFGARRGAYSGAVADADGYLQAADGGTLFLDEIAELEPPIQAKLLRAIEAREVLPLGATKPRSVDVRLCAATTNDLHADVARGRFREDLYFRIGRPEVRVPPLRERLDEIPWLVDLVRARLVPASPTASAAFVEACLLRHWPGNVRELLVDVRTAALEALGHGRSEIEASDLPARAGARIHAAAPSTDDPRTAEAAAIREALIADRGNVVRAAARLGLTRAKLRRLLELYRIDVAALKR